LTTTKKGSGPKVGQKMEKPHNSRVTGAGTGKEGERVVGKSKETREGFVLD